MRAHVRDGVAWWRFDTSRQATRRSAVLTVVLAPLLLGISRAYRAASPAEVIPPDLYARFGDGVGGLTVTGYLAASDAVGRAWLAAAGWVPETAAWLVLGTVLVAYYAAACEFGWRLLREVQADIEAEQGGETA